MRKEPRNDPSGAQPVGTGGCADAALTAHPKTVVTINKQQYCFIAASFRSLHRLHAAGNPLLFPLLFPTADKWAFRKLGLQLSPAAPACLQPRRFVALEVRIVSAE